MGGRESRTKEAEKRGEEQRAARAALIGRVGGSGTEEGRGRGLLVLGAEKGSSLIARLRYSWNEPGLCGLAQTELPNPRGRKKKVMNIHSGGPMLSALLYVTDDGNQRWPMRGGGPCVCYLLRSGKRH